MLIVTLTLLLDLIFGEPPVRFHAVVWMGDYLKFARSRWMASSPKTQLLEGGGWWLLGAISVFGLAFMASNVLRLLPAWLEVFGTVLLLKPMLSLKSLFAAVQAVQHPLELGLLENARKMLAWHLVSRDTSQLREDEVIGASIESLFENLSDALIAPILCFLIGGLPLAALYRFANTADAMWGYRTPAFLYSGRVAARADDLLNLIPARVTGGCLAALNLVAWRIMLRDGLQTSSPNAGIPMAAGAGALAIRLEKRNLYALNTEARAPRLTDISRAKALAKQALLVFLGCCVLLEVLF